MDSVPTITCRRKAGAVAIATVLFATFTPAVAQAQSTNSYALVPKWSAAVGNVNYPFLANDNTHRGLAINPVTGDVLVVSRTSVGGTTAIGPAVYVLDGESGAFKYTLPDDPAVITTGNFKLNMVEATADGAVYACNLTTDTIGGNGPLRIYRWSAQDTNVLPVLAYSGDPSNGDADANNRRFGDSMSVRGTGTGTQIILGSRLGTSVAVLTTADGTNFTHQKITTDGLSGDFQVTIEWGAGDTFFGKLETSATRPVPVKRFHINYGTGTATNDLTISGLAGSGGPLAVDNTRQLLGLVRVANHTFSLWDISAPADLIQQDTTKPFPTSNANGNVTGDVDFSGDKVAVLESNNGILMYQLVATNVAPTITTQPASATILQETANWTFSVTRAGTRPFSYQWQHNGADIPGATNLTYTLTNVNPTNAGNYRVLVQNAMDSVYSSNAVLTVISIANTAQMTNIWNLVPGDRPYLTTDYKQYGMAFNPATSNLLVISRVQGSVVTNTIAVLDGLTGAEKGFLNTSGMGGGTFDIHKVDVSDDGVVYVCNLTTAATSPPFRIYRYDSDDTNVLPYEVFIGDPGAGWTPNRVWGRNMAVRGSGNNTQILLSSEGAGSTNVALLTTSDGGQTFTTVTRLTVAGVSEGFARLGLCWGPGTNTFFGKVSGSSLYLIQFDATTGSAFVLGNYGADSYPFGATSIAYDPNSKLLGSIGNWNTPKFANIYYLPDPVTGPQLRDQEVFSTYNPSIEYSGAVDFGNNYFFALDTNNGIKAFRVNPAYVPPPPPFRITGVVASGGSIELTWQSVSGNTYQVQYKDAVGDAVWLDLGAPILATGSTTSATNSVTGSTRFFRINGN